MTRLLGILGLAAFLLVPASAHGQCVNCVEGDCNTAAAVDTTLSEDCDSVADAVAAGCPGTQTPFNGDHTAGIQVMNTTNFTDDNGPIGQFTP